MKRLFFILVIVLTQVLIVYSQQNKNDTIFSLVNEKILKNSYIENINRYDSITQENIIRYAELYSANSILCNNAGYFFDFLWTSFLSSKYTSIRRQTILLLLKIYRLDNIEMGHIWYQKARIEDFDVKAKERIIKIIQASPFTDEEKSIRYNNELRMFRKLYKNDTVLIWNDRRKSKLPIEQLRDSVAKSIASSNVDNLRPEQFIQPGILTLAAWLNMPEVVPVVKKILEKPENRNVLEYKMILARFGEQDYVDELLRDTNIIYDFHKLGFIRSTKVIDLFISKLTNDKTKYSQKMIHVGVIEIQMPFICSFLQNQRFNKLFLNFPYDCSQINEDCTVTEQNKKMIIEWLIKNKSNPNILNPELH